LPSDDYILLISVDIAGDYRVGIKFNDLHIPDSPYKVYVSPQIGDAKKVEIGQFPDTVTTVNKPIAFIVQKNGAKGTLDCKVRNTTQSIDPNIIIDNVYDFE
jgi:filamin